jgi:hypothetical protein
MIHMPRFGLTFMRIWKSRQWCKNGWSATLGYRESAPCLRLKQRTRRKSGVSELPNSTAGRPPCAPTDRPSPGTFERCRRSKRACHRVGPLPSFRLRRGKQCQAPVLPRACGDFADHRLTPLQAGPARAQPRGVKGGGKVFPTLAPARGEICGLCPFGSAQGRAFCEIANSHRFCAISLS